MKPRILTGAGLLLLVSVAAHAGNVYTDPDEFLAVVCPDYFLNPFDDVVFGPTPPLIYGPVNGYEYVISAPGGLFCDTGEVSTDLEGDAIMIDFPGPPISAFAGNFWVRDIDFNVIPGQVTLVYSDGTKDVFQSAAKGTFRGYTTSEEPLIQVQVLALADDDVDGWAVLDNLYVGLLDTARECYIDCDCNHSNDLFDFFCYMNEFNAGSEYADCDLDGSLNLFDFLCFINKFDESC